MSPWQKDVCINNLCRQEGGMTTYTGISVVGHEAVLTTPFPFTCTHSHTKRPQPDAKGSLTRACLWRELLKLGLQASHRPRQGALLQGNHSRSPPPPRQQCRVVCEAPRCAGPATAALSCAGSGVVGMPIQIGGILVWALLLMQACTHTPSLLWHASHARARTLHACQPQHV